MYKELDVKDKTIIVTGGAKGIGAACCRLFCEKGANVIIADIDYENAFKVEKSVKENGGEIFAVKTDISKEADVKNMVQKAKEKYGKIDILVNDAAVQEVNSFQDISISEWEKVIDVNLNGTFLCSREVTKEFENGGQIINMLSVHSQLPRVNKYHYDASKAGIEILTKELALNYADKNISVNAVSFGAVATPMNEDWLGIEEKVKNTLSKVPMSIIFKPEEIARFVYEVLKNFSLYTTGSVFVVDGGRSLTG